MVQTERRIGVDILELLWEIERRKSYSELGYDGIYSFCIRELKFTEAQAYHRIQAMRALKMNSKEVGLEIKNKIDSGAMSVSTVAQVQVFLRKEEVKGKKRTEVEKLELFNRFENKSSQEVKKGIAELQGERIKMKLIIELDAETESLWNEFKECTAFQTKGDERLQLKLLLTEALKTREAKAARTSCAASVTTWPKRKPNIEATLEVPIPTVPTPTKPIVTKQTDSKHFKTSVTRVSRHIPVQLRRQIFNRDHYKCVNCDSKYAISIEHKTPFAQGGNQDPSNLEVLCRNCNLHKGVKEFGLETMRR